MRISLLGLPPLMQAGIAHYLQQLDGEVVTEACVISNSGPADAYIVSASALATKASLLMPRLDRVLLVTYSYDPAHEGLRTLSPLAKEDEIHKILKKFLSVCVSADKPFHSTNLSDREREVLILTASGLSAKQIADKLFISANTVTTHRKNIAAKTGLHTTSAITHFAMRHGLMHME